MILDQILAAGTVEDNATRHVLTDSMLSSARNEDHYQLLVQWFKTGHLTDTAGTQLEGVEVSLKHKHAMMERIWSSETIPLETKNELMNQLAELDKSDWLDNTKTYCEAAHPGNKDKMWALYFSREKNETEDWGLHHW